MLRSRRDALRALVTTAAALLIFSRREGARRRLTGPSAARPAQLDPELGIEPGALFAGSVVTSVEQVSPGTLAVHLRDPAGQRFTVDLLGHDPTSPGVARAGSVEAYLSNDGDGVLATVEEQGLAAMAIADSLADKERSGVRLPSLLTLRERAERRRNPRLRA
jgi:hypothetical protein